MIGVDYDDIALRTASRRSLPTLHLLHADAGCLPLPSACADLILIRHPDVDRAPGGWARAVQNAAYHLTLGGVLLVTTYTAQELQQVQAWLADAVAPLLPLALTPQRLAPVGLQGRDRQVFAATLSAVQAQPPTP